MAAGRLPRRTRPHHAGIDQHPFPVACAGPAPEDDVDDDVALISEFSGHRVGAVAVGGGGCGLGWVDGNLLGHHPPHVLVVGTGMVAPAVGVPVGRGGALLADGAVQERRPPPSTCLANPAGGVAVH